MVRGIKPQILVEPLTYVGAECFKYFIAQAIHLTMLLVLCANNHGWGGGATNYYIAGGMWNGSYTQSLDSSHNPGWPGVFQVYIKPDSNTYYSTGSWNGYHWPLYASRDSELWIADSWLTTQRPSMGTKGICTDEVRKLGSNNYDVGSLGRIIHLLVIGGADQTGTNCEHCGSMQRTICDICRV